MIPSTILHIRLLVTIDSVRGEGRDLIMRRRYDPSDSSRSQDIMRASSLKMPPGKLALSRVLLQEKSQRATRHKSQLPGEEGSARAGRQNRRSTNFERHPLSKILLKPLTSRR